MIPSWTKDPDPSGKPQSREDIYFNWMSWGFIGVAVGLLTAYLASVVAQSHGRKTFKQLSHVLQEIRVSEDEVPEWEIIAAPESILR